MQSKNSKDILYGKQKLSFGNKPSRHLANLLSPWTQFKVKCMSSLKDKARRVLSSEEDKMKEFVTYYKNVYDSSNPDKNKL